jgi:hypothetical protein
MSKMEADLKNEIQPEFRMEDNKNLFLDFSYFRGKPFLGLAQLSKIFRILMVSKNSYIIH